MQPDSPLYVIGSLIHGEGSIDPARLAQALDLVVAKHDALRTVVSVDESGVPVLRVQDSHRSDLQLLYRPSGNAVDDWRKAHLQQLAKRVLPLFAGPAWECQLLFDGVDRWTLVCRIHHILCDGIGLALILRDFERCYNALTDTRSAGVEIVPSFVDANARESEYLASPRFDRDQKFWSARHRQLEPVLFESEQFEATAVQRSGQVVLTIPRLRFDELSGLAAQAGCSISHLLIALIGAYFARVHGRSSVVIGLAVHNRHGATHRRTVGMFSSVLPLRVSVNADASLGETMSSVAAEIRQCFRHQRFPMVELNRRLRPQRHGRNQAYDISFSFEAFGGGYRFGDCTANGQALDNGHEPLPLAISVRDYDPSRPIEIAFNHRLQALDTRAVQRLVSRLETTLASIGNALTQPIRGFPLLTASERDELLGHSRASTPAASFMEFAHHRIAQQALLTPAALAVVGKGVALTYAELNGRANRVAHWLLEQGVRPDDRVGLCVRRGSNLLVALLGVMKSGAAYLPLDPDYPPRRLAHMLADASPVALISESVSSAALPEHSIATLWMDRADALARQPDYDPPLPELQTQNLAYVIYTSGSTGTPKGVMVEHAQLAQQIDTHVAQCELSADDRMLQFASVSFDSAVVEIFPALAVGATLVLRPDSASVPDDGWVEYLDQQRVTVTDLPTVFWAQWAQQIAAGTSRPSRALRLVVVGGEKVERRHLQAWLAAPSAADCRFLNTYGPTEATVYVSTIGFASGASCPQGEVSIGRPTGDSRIYLLDRSGQLLPPGAIGEICIGGPGVARGYLHRPELTAERFIADPFSAQSSARLYRTGDLGRWREDGQLEFHGRDDQQIKIRGFRIELGEIEAALATHAHVREVVVVVRGEGAQARLIAFVVAKAAANPVESRVLREHLSHSLAEHMLPVAYVSLPALPLSVNGKIDRSALPQVDASAIATREYVAPLNPLEQTLANLWQELLGVERVGREDSFFELGGHSLLVVSLLERLRQSGIAIDVRTLFTAPNLAALASVLSLTADQPLAADAGQAPPNRIPTDTTAITPAMLSMVDLDQAAIDLLCAVVDGGGANIQDLYPLAPLQEGMLFHHLLDGVGDGYLMQTVMAFASRSAVDGFVGALQQVIDRHDALRTSIHWQGLAQPLQVVQRQANLLVQELQSGAGDALAQLLAASDPRYTRLDLRRAPLLAAYVIDDEVNQRCLLALLDHHIVCDHVTLEQMIDEVGLILRGREQELPQPWPYRHFVAHTLATPASSHEAYFQQQFADVAEASAPFGVLAVHDTDDNAVEAVLPIDALLAQRIRERARAEGISPSVLFHLAWALVVARCSGRDEAVFGTVLAGRSQGSAGADQAMGLFLNTLPVRIALAEQTVRDALHDTHRRLAELLAHEQAPLALAQRASGVAPSQPLFTCILNYRHSDIDPIDNAGEEGIAIRGWDGMRVLRVDERTNYPLSVSIDDGREQFGIVVHAVAEIGAERIGQMFHTTIAALAGAAPTASLLGLNVLSENERQRIAQFAGIEQAHPLLDQHVDRLIAAHAYSRAAATALASAKERISYGELQSRACRWANSLQRQGVQPKDLIALHMLRGADLIVAILAVWKAGAAYLPLDPEYPQPRLQFMLDDSRPRLVLVDRGSADAVTERFPGLGTASILGVDLLDALASESLVQAVGLDLNDPAYVIYTSGSTGTPKGVVVSHRGLGNLVQTQVQALGVDTTSGVLQFSSPSFDASVSELLMALCTGARLHLPERDALIPGAPLLEVLRDLEITHATLPASALAACGEDAAELIPAAKLTLVVAGDVLPPLLAQRWSATQTLFNAYGPTEATVCVSMHRCDPQTTGMVPIGQVLPNVVVRVLDQRGYLLPIGTVGEICIGGISVANGYLHRPELTAERFIADPVSTDPTARLYCSGDLGRWRADGQLEFHGRNDQQIKIRGFRVELGEIEAALATHPLISEAAVVARTDNRGTRLIAYFVPRKDSANLDARELRQHLSQSLTEHMQPVAYVQLTELPLSSNGKIDRQALPAPGEEALVRAEHVPPVGETEIVLARIWVELLRVPQVGRDDDFSALGGHSLLTMQLATRVRDQFGVELALRELFERSAFAEQAAMLVSAQLERYVGVETTELEDELGEMSEEQLQAMLMEEISDES